MVELSQTRSKRILDIVNLGGNIEARGDNWLCVRVRDKKRNFSISYVGGVGRMETIDRFWFMIL